jgi:hypothetical protein
VEDEDLVLPDLEIGQVVRVFRAGQVVWTGFDETRRDPQEYAERIAASTSPCGAGPTSAKC